MQACSMYSGGVGRGDSSCAYSHHSSVHMPSHNVGVGVGGVVSRDGGMGGGYVMGGSGNGSVYGDGSSSVMFACRPVAPHTPTSSRSERSYQGSSSVGPAWTTGRYDRFGQPVRL